MIDELYHKEILRLASDAHGSGRLPKPSASATVDNPLCGDRITIDVELTDGRVKALGFEAKACLLCQASASMLCTHAIGKTGSDIETGMGALDAFLRSDRQDADGAFAIFAPVRAHKSRHRCLLLPYEALIAALAHLHETGQTPANGHSP